MVYTSQKRKLKEKPTYDTALYSKLKPQNSNNKISKRSAAATPGMRTAATSGMRAIDWASNGPVQSSPTPAPKGAGTRKWRRDQREYAEDYLARIKERYIGTSIYDEFVEAIRKYNTKELDSIPLWREVCRLLYASPGLCDEFKNFMKPEYRNM